MENFKCQVRLGVIFKRTCSNFGTAKCSTCGISVCAEHLQNRSNPGSEQCPKCFMGDNPDDGSIFMPGTQRNRWRRNRYYDRHDRMHNDEFSDEDYAVFDQMNEDGSLELDDSYDS